MGYNNVSELVDDLCQPVAAIRPKKERRHPLREVRFADLPAVTTRAGMSKHVIDPE